ncbi:helix-turn-helix domain-containing GNAT family N-acetyltransferase [Vibrio rhizosphaerae]|uniref:Helix-turn-helix domain-containing GNAT family N-acetyltransferase n=1 Tax=Vibrio rhizosphaerae TaxID=398736 RepID=A0ABU4IWX3_9VIBR|nr:helix-turn-helix domain-containing GNAT family N-acetyltransferase [Vibrio rhizosphaerae]MDW6093896.1 helix-turn-helix domain-containing GNAT family N-acetyltransferase [Vibrio rhizosphaerae]
MISNSDIDAIRASSRQLVRQLGFMGGPFAGTDLSPSAVHALMEIENGESVTARYLSDCLQLEKSSVSRMLRKLMATGDIQEEPHARDARSKQLKLTPAGQKRVAAIHAFAQHQVTEALKHLNRQQEKTIIDGLQLYADALSGRLSVANRRPEIKISTGYCHGLIAQITAMHSAYYSRETGFGQPFESAVASGLAEFCGRLDHAHNEIWVAKLGEEIVGSIAIDGEDLGPGKAHLRWFIVDDKARGTGVGHQLLTAALAFVDASGFDETHLYTVEGLEAAHHLYEKYGFSRIEQYVGEQWGKAMTELRFMRAHP